MPDGPLSGRPTVTSIAATDLAEATTNPDSAPVSNNITWLNVINSLFGFVTAKLGLAAGGTNADLAGTGSASAFLAQNTSHVISARNIVEADIVAGLTDVITGDVSTAKHGYAPKAAAPAVDVRNALVIDNGETTPSFKAILDSTNPATQAFGDASSPGTSLFAAHRDHQHGMPAVPYDNTNPTTQNFGDSPAPGVATKLARVDHKHGMPTVVPTVAARVYHNAIQDGFGSWASVAFNQERFDNDVIHDNAVNNSRLTCKTAGKYLISATAELTVTGWGIAPEMRILLNSTTVIARVTPGTGTANQGTFGISTIYDLAVNDYVELQVSFNAPQGRVVASGNYSPEFMMARLG